MISLIETYARSTGLKIGKPWVKEDFWPMPHARFVTFSAGSGQAAKNYTHFQIVIDMLNPVLAPLDIRIVQLGDANTQLFSGTYDLRGKMTVAQSSNLINRALVHFGVDSWSAHAAGILKTPLVALYGTTDKESHGPYWKDVDKTILLESHRHGRKPTFGAENNPKTVDLIPPEDIANAVLRLLGLPQSINRQTQFIGPLYQHTIFDWVPNSSPSLNLGPDIPITARMDLVHSEQNLLALLQSGRKITIVTKAPIDLNLLASFKGSVLSYSHELGADCPLGYPPMVKRLLSNVVFFTRDSDDARVSAIRFKFFDVCSIEQVLPSTKADYLRERATYLNIPLDNTPTIDTMRMRTNKFIMANGKTYLSYAHEVAGVECTGIDARDTTVLDDERLWRDLAHFMIYQPT